MTPNHLTAAAAIAAMDWTPDRLIGKSRARGQRKSTKVGRRAKAARKVQKQARKRQRGAS